MAITSIVQALRTQNASELISWGLRVAICPVSPLLYLLVSALITQVHRKIWVEETSGCPFLMEGPISYSEQCQHWIQTRFHRKVILGTVKKLAALSVNVRNIIEKRSWAFILGWEEKWACFFLILVCGFTVNTGTVLKQHSIFLNSFASKNLHMWKRTEEEKITRDCDWKVLNTSSPK